ncbi:AraC family transcriptional regulator [Acidimangrovimonas sediminis]|uniref:AraC family transcriptional regulator n=1 Tax=Acidimangrovimonas sediminis TaxID=2056283 RepID=UPI000C7FC2C5|nr:AraC family transcriptional regulator [Acidimangrovimonas sediminis]
MVTKAQLITSVGSSLGEYLDARGDERGQPTPGQPTPGQPTPGQAPREGETIPLSEFAGALERLAAATRVPDLGLRFAERFDLRRLGPLGYLMQSAETLHAALHDYVRHYPKVQSDTAVDFEIRGGTAVVTYEVRDGANYERAQDAEFSTGIILNYSRRLCGTAWHLDTLSFSHPAQRQRRFASGGFTPEFSAGQNGFSFPAELLEHPNPRADPGLAAILRTHLGKLPPLDTGTSPISEQVQAAIVEALNDDQDTSIEAIAARIGRSARVLQRVVAAEGQSFRNLRSEALVSMACLWLASTDRPITDIALDLGFSEVSAFSRFFRNRLGLSPIRYRQQEGRR